MDQGYAIQIYEAHTGNCNAALWHDNQSFPRCNVHGRTLVQSINISHNYTTKNKTCVHKFVIYTSFRRSN